MRDDRKWQSKLARARVDGAWGALDVYSDGGADGANTPAAPVEYGWMIITHLIPIEFEYNFQTST